MTPRARVTAITVVYNSRKFLEPVLEALIAQTHENMAVIAVICKSEDDSREFIEANYPGVRIIDPGGNVGFAKAHNLVFERNEADFVQLVNPDLVLERDYVQRMLQAFRDTEVGAATGKLLQYDFDNSARTNVIDSTGVIVSTDGRAKDRGQHEVDTGQYDLDTELLAVTGAGAMFRREALEAAKMRRSGDRDHKSTPPTGPSGQSEYFDEDFHTYGEDVDLCWRMVSLGYKSVYVPGAVAYHGRGVGSSRRGYSNLRSFVKHRKKIPLRVRRMIYKNHILLMVKNAPRFYLRFFARELAMFGYLLLFEPMVLGILPTLFRQIRRALLKRAEIKKNQVVQTRGINGLFMPDRHEVRTEQTQGRHGSLSE